MAERPFLPLPEPRREPRPPRIGGGGRTLRLPSRGRQRERFTRRIRELEQALQQRHATLQADVAGAAPDEVLVLDVAGGIGDFVRAVQRTPDMEWLTETDEFSVEADEDFGADEEHPDDPLRARLYLVMANQEAIRQLRGIWLQFNKDVRERGQKWPYGLTKWRDLFDHLRDIRYWDQQDRLASTGLVEDWRERLAEGVERVPVEVELWFREREEARTVAEGEVRRIIGEDGGQIIGQSTVSEIRYHGVLAEVPIATAQRLIESRDTQMVRAQQVMFLRPVGQLATPTVGEESTEHQGVIEGEAPSGEPVVALLDGLPLVNHELLSGRVLLDDPDGWEAGYQAQERRHGTGMASVIVHGDLAEGEAPISAPLYARPIMKPNPRDINRTESVPEDELAVDLIQRAVRRIVAPDTAAAAPTVRIINLSVCDAARPFDRDMSPLARLLDWLAWRYNLLWIISAGNCLQALEVDVEPSQAATLSEEERVRAILTSVWNDSANRRMLSPAEAMNGITINAVHGDASATTLATEFATFPDGGGYPSPLNPLGFGYRRSMKPDVLCRGGRQPYLRRGISEPPVSLERVGEYSGAPGIQVACPGSAAGDLTATRHTRGTSNSAAMVSHLAGRVYQALSHTPSQTGGVPEEFRTVATKALVVHSARWNERREEIVGVVGTSREREMVGRFLGYGIIDEERALTATDQRATLIGWGRLAQDDSDVYSLPLPPSLSGVLGLRRLVVTLAWLSPISPGTRRYRVAALRVDPVDNGHRTISVERREADNRLVQRGTLQHEVFEGARAAAFADGEQVRLRVSCAADAGPIPDLGIPYSLAVSLEVAEEIDIPIYDEIETRIRPLITVPVP